MVLFQFVRGRLGLEWLGEPCGGGREPGDRLHLEEPGDAPHSDTEEKSQVYETDVSINDSETSSHPPPKKKKTGRNQTHSKGFSAEMRDLISEMDNNETARPSPSRSSCTSEQKKRRTIDNAILTRLAHLDHERQKFRRQDNEDFRFAAVIVDMLANIKPKHKSEVKLKIYQMLYEAGRDFPKES